MRKRKILMLTWGPTSHSSSRIRALDYLPLFKKEGDDSFTVISRTPERTHLLLPIFFPLKKRLLWLYRCFAILFLRFDLIFIQRWFLSPFLIKVLTIKQTPFIYDFDDAIFIDTPKQPGNSVQANRMIKHASRVIVSSPILAEYCQKQGVTAEIITTPVDLDQIIQKDYDKSTEKFTIGWIGSTYTTPFLEIVVPVLRKISERNNFRVLLIGADRNYLIPGLPVEYLDWSIETENHELQQMDVGIMPLPDTAWAQGKGGYKLYLYMAAGIPVVASPVGINREIVKHGENGFLATSREDWEKYLLLLSKDQSLRKTMGQAGRQQAKEKYDRRVCFELVKKCFTPSI